MPDSDHADVIETLGVDPDTLEHTPRCWDCGVAVGHAHHDRCDVARCLATGGQRLSCGRDHPGGCGADVHTGLWPGEAEAHAYGLVVAGMPDLNRLVVEGAWDPVRQLWTHPAAPEPALRRPAG